MAGTGDLRELHSLLERLWQGYAADKAWRGKRTIGVIDVVNASGVSAIGGAFVIAHVDVANEGTSACSRPVGVTKEHKVSLLRFNVVDKGSDGGVCTTTQCVFVTRE
jgi:hypothetical protein